jgi:hypothetical protein
MTTGRRLAAWVLAALASVPLVFFAAFSYFSAIIEDEYRTGVRVSTDGDVATTPAAGITAAWLSLLVVVAAAALLLVAARRYRAKRSKSAAPPN